MREATSHACPTSAGSVTACCGMTPAALPSDDLYTLNPERVTCSASQHIAVTCYAIDPPVIECSCGERIPATSFRTHAQRSGDA